MEKTALRKQGMQVLKHLVEHPQLKQEKEAKIYRSLFAQPFWKNAKTIGLVMSMPHELNTQPIIERGYKENKHFAVPKTFTKGEMAFIAIDKDTAFEKSKFGVSEPINGSKIDKIDIDLMIVPGVVFSSDGYRIGYGGGFYDRYLADFSGITVSLVFKEQLLNGWQPDVYDLPVKYLISD